MKHKPDDPRPNEPIASTVQDTADILEEVDAEVDENGKLVADEEKVLKLGALDSESVRVNQRMRDYTRAKKAGKKNVPFNTDDVLEKYQMLLSNALPDNFTINVRRLTGTPVQQVIISRPRSGAELYEALMSVHGRYSEAEYEVKFFDINKHQFRGITRITLPDTTQQGQPMAYVPPQQQQQAPAPQPQQQAPTDLISQLEQLLGLAQRVAVQQTQPAPQPAAPAQPDVGQLVQLLGALQRLVPAQRGQAQQQPQPQPQAQQTPQFPRELPPEGCVWQWLPESNCCVAMPIPRQEAPRQTPAYGPRYNPRQYYPQGGEPERPYYPQGQQPPQRPADPVREAFSVIQQAMSTVDNFRSLVGQPEGGAVQETDDDDSPVIVKDKVAYDKRDGSVHWAATGANLLPDVLKWVGEQREAIQKANAERQRPKQQLPPGYVEVGPNYQPPPGYVAVPVDEVPQHEPVVTPPPAPQQELPPPPAQMPPPIQTNPWGMPRSS